MAHRDTESTSVGALPNFPFEKRRKELEKKARKEEKKKRKLEAADAPLPVEAEDEGDPSAVTV
jgi:hypothetical protein